MIGIHRRYLLKLLLAFVAALTSGCAVGNTHTFRYAPATGEDLGNGRVVVVFGVEDLRKDIVEGDEPPSWVGEQRSGYGIPFTVKTTDGKAFADVVQETLQRDLESVGFRTAAVDETSPRDVGRALAEAEAERGLVVAMRVFNSDTYWDTDVEWDFEATVYEPGGRSLASNRIQGKDELSGAPGRQVPPFFYDLMRQLVVGDPDMVEALTQPAPR